MPVSIRLYIFGLLNLAALIYLIEILISRGNSFSKALGLAWELMLGETKNGAEANPGLSLVWVPIFRKSWWLMLAAYAVFWLIVEELWMTIGIILLIGLHVFWYLYASLNLATKYDRILRLNSDWGIIYQEIGPDSPLIQKSLAELDLRKKNLLILTIERNNKITSFPKGLEIIQAGDRVIMFGDLNAYRAVFG